MTSFRYDDAIVEQFPSIVGGVIYGSGVRNGPAPGSLADAFAVEQHAVLTRIGQTPLSELPSIAAWRRTFAAFGVEPTRYRSAAEALLRRLAKQGALPSLSLLVDLGNLVSIRYGLPVAMFDQGDVAGGTTVRFASGSERFTDLGTETVDNPVPGEVVFVDDAGLVSARRWCWRQSAQSATRDETREILVTVEGLHEAARGDVEAATADLLALLAEHCPAAQFENAILTQASVRTPFG